MRLYIWRSKAPRNYGDGWIIVMAETETAARTQAREAAISSLKEYWSSTEEDDEDFIEMLRVLEADIAKEPRQGTACCVWGSE